MNSKLSLLAFFLVFAFIGCVNDAEPEDTITIPVAPSGSVYAVLNGNEEIHSSELRFIYDRVDSTLSMYTKFSNGCYLIMDYYHVSLSAPKDINNQTFTGYFWDPRKMQSTYIKWGDDYGSLYHLEVDTIAHTISGKFTYHILFGKPSLGSRLTQGSFTDVPFTIEPKGEETFDFTIGGLYTNDPENYVYNNNYLNHPNEILTLGLYGLNNDPNTMARVIITLPIKKIQVGSHDIVASAYDIFSNFMTKDQTTEFLADSVKSGTLTITSYDRENRSISGSFSITTNASESGAPSIITGSFNNLSWKDQINYPY